MAKALKNHLTNQNKPTPQTEQAHPDQKQNNAGGFSFVVSDRSRLERFLILGTDGGTYYVSEQDLTKNNVDWLIELIKTNAPLVLNTVADISRNGKAYRNSAAIFVLALVFKYGDDEAKSVAKVVFNDVVRTSTHLFEFAEFVELLGANSHTESLRSPQYLAGMAEEAQKIESDIREATGRSKKINARDRFSGSHTGGWGRSKRSAVKNWYLSQTRENLAYQAVKYRQRHGWTHQDLFRLSHPKGIDQNVANFILGKEVESSFDGNGNIIDGFLLAQRNTNVNDLLAILDDYQKLPWEALPTQFLKEPDVWKKLFHNNQLNGQALLRNVVRLARIGAFADMVLAHDFATRLTDEEMIRRTRLHPIQYLLALVNYQNGQVQRRGAGVFGYVDGGRRKDWETNPVVVTALNEGFYKAFKFVEPAGKRTMIGLDVSASMSSLAMGIDLSCAEVGAAMAMTVARTERYYQIRGFADNFRDLGISPAMDLDTVLKITRAQNFGGTDCALPMTYAISHNLEVDTFVVITDSETWSGRDGHPHERLEQYRQKTGIPARLVVMGMTATNISIANPNDSGMLDVVGADTSTPKLVADFSAGRI